MISCGLLLCRMYTGITKCFQFEEGALQLCGVLAQNSGKCGSVVFEISSHQNWLVLNDEQMSKGWLFSLLNFPSKGSQLIGGGLHKPVSLEWHPYPFTILWGYNPSYPFIFGH